MNFQAKELVKTFYKYYPYTRYIFKQPKSLSGCPFSSMNLSEFIVLDENSVHLKFKTLKGEMLMFSMNDLADHVQDAVRKTVLSDFGSFAFACLNNNHLDRTELDNVLETQKKLLEEKYGTVLVRENSKLY